MIHFIRNEKNEPLLDLEVFTLKDGTPELSVSIDIGNYTNFLLKQSEERQQEMTKYIFIRLSEARGWYWEVYKETINKNPTKEDVDGVIGLMVRSAAQVLRLEYVTD